MTIGARYVFLGWALLFAAGEAMAAAVSPLAGLWPAIAVALLLVVLAGYGFSWRWWREAAFVLMGIAVFFFSVVDLERDLRARPWMRERLSRREAYRPPAELVRMRREFSARMAIGVEEAGEAVDLSRAILLGERSRIRPDTRRAFVEAGSVHIFSISGLHVMAIAVALMAAASAMQFPWRWCGVAALPLLWAYVLLIGAPPSAVRAGAMATINFMAPVFLRRPDSLMSWSITFFAVHIFSPRMICDVGCRLSFAVMLSLILAGEFVRSRFTGWKAAAIVSYAAWAGGVPIAAAVFSRVTPGGLLANLLLMPAAGVSVWVGMMGVVASYISEMLAAHLNNLGALAVRFMVGVSVAVSRLPLANFEIEPLSFLEAIVWYLILFLPFALYFVYRRFRLF